ncbi:MAG: 3-phosphoshikimate 1-carboxyvinyltransferase [Spirochaetes bacterium]|nr:MAG: 3-phosphoshikimate 1-carboxyvinyltransferase [Spirochaetota bacterium]RLA91622.1 MAG: 3-phosphoshikimate 1-carboxyvinyltransferase [Deltaproteobacteria bacterium]
MKFVVSESNLKGTAKIPGSKSNTTRAVFIATMAEGTSIIHNPLPSADCLSTVDVCRGFGASIEIEDNWIVHGVGLNLKVPEDVLDMGNSGTTYYIATAVATLINGFTVITGDHQIRRRPAGPLIAALNDLGGMVFSTRGGGIAPLVARGILKGGKAHLPGINSQWLTPILLTAPLALGDTEVEVDNLQERPYINMTMGWLKRQNIEFSHDNYERFFIKGGQSYHPFEETIPSDWESATFPIVAAAITDSEITLMGLDINDYQGDKAIIENLKRMGADIEVKDDGKNGITIKGGKTLHGIEIDCGDLPDAPPILAVLGTRAKGKTVLTNLGPSRIKETDRPKAIYEELTKMGAKMELTKDSLTIYESELTGTHINGHHDHRIVMATTIAGFIAKGKTEITDAEYHKISFPNFYEVMTTLGGKIEKIE